MKQMLLHLRLIMIPIFQQLYSVPVHFQELRVVFQYKSFDLQFYVDPHDYELLRKFVTEHGKIISSRLSGASAKQQRQIKSAVRRARVLGLIP